MFDRLWWFSYWLNIDHQGELFLAIWLLAPILTFIVTRQRRYLLVTMAGIIFAFWWVVPLVYGWWQLQS